MAEEQNPNLSDEELRNIKTQYNKAKGILENIIALSVKYENAVQEIKAKEGELENVSNEVRSALSSVENFKESAAGALNDIKSNLEKIQQHISAVEEGALRFATLQGKVEGSNNEIATLLETANSLKQDVEQSKTSAQQKLAEIDQLLGQVQERISNMQGAYETFLSLNQKITDENTGLQAILNQVSELQKKAGAVVQEISSFRDEARKFLSDIQKNKEESEKIKEEIKNNLEQTNLDRDQVAEVTALITDTGFANSFKEREKKLFAGSVVWLIILLAGIGILMLLLYTFFGKLDTIPSVELVVFRLSLTSPLIILIGFAIAQYKNDRTLTERYAFKAVIAAVVRNHARFLSQLSKEDGVETVDFARKTIAGIYKEPYLKEGRKQKTEKINFRERLDIAKELKETIPDSETLKAVIELFIKLR